MKNANSGNDELNAKFVSRGISTDMSSKAVIRRLEIVDELRELAEQFKAAKRLGPIDSPTCSSEKLSSNEAD